MQLIQPLAKAGGFFVDFIQKIYYHPKMEDILEKVLENALSETNPFESTYLMYLAILMRDGDIQTNRTGVNTRMVFSPALHFDLAEGFPALTTRRVFFRGAVEELLWMLKGQTDSGILKEKNIHIWDGNTTREFLDNRGLKDMPEGEIGTLYGFQMRNWGGDYYDHLATGKRTGIDQIEKILNTLKTNPSSRRIVLSNYNVSQLDTGVLEPCHTMYIFTVNQAKNTLNCHLTLRSWDMCCGAPINIMFTALLTTILAKCAGLTPGICAFTGVDAHIYENHIPQIKQQAVRAPYKFPKLKFDKDISTIEDIEGLTFEDFELEDYNYHSPIKYEMSV